MYSSLRKLYLEFSVQQKKRLMMLLLVVVVTAFIQVMGIASIFPFIAVASSPDMIDSNVYLSTFKIIIGVEDNRHFLVILGGVVLLTIILTNAFLALTAWLTMRFVAITVHDLQYGMLQRYLNETYLFHLNRNSSELLKNLTEEVARVVNGGIVSAISIISKGFSALCILVFLIVVDPYIALMVGLVLGGAYAMIYWIIKTKLSNVGVTVTKLFSDRMCYLNESLSGIKELMVLGREQFYLTRFYDVSKRLVKYKVYSQSVTQLPRYLLETVAFGGVLIITIYLIAVKNDVQTVLPMISLYGLAGYRLMPALQGVFQSTATLKHDIAAVDLLCNDLVYSAGSKLIKEEKKLEEKKISVRRELFLDNISFHYPDSAKLAVNQLTLRIGANTSIGVVGSSGSGKSTLVDIILGLLHPQQGEVLVDGQQLTPANMRLLRRNIGYVPQVIFLADSSISENVAFGVPPEQIDHLAVERATKMANLHEFIINELDNGYETVVGERGMRLSGGQRQRIGIARALYHDPDILILDEATSALDTPTEKSIIESVYKLAHRKTIIMIAHRISTVKECDEIIVMDKGKLVDAGKYEELLTNSRSFRKLLLKKD